MKKIFVVIFVGIILAGCSSVGNYRTKFAENHDLEKLYKSAIQAMVESNFVITESDIKAGVLSGTKGSIIEKVDMTVVVAEVDKVIHVSVNTAGIQDNNQAAIIGEKIKKWYSKLSGEQVVEVKTIVKEMPVEKEVKEVKKELKNDTEIVNAVDSKEDTEKSVATETQGEAVALKAEIGGYMFGDNKSVTNLDPVKWTDVEITFVYNIGGEITKYKKRFKKLSSRRPKSLVINEMKDDEGSAPPKDIGKPHEIFIEGFIRGKKGTFHWIKKD